MLNKFCFPDWAKNLRSIDFGKIKSRSTIIKISITALVAIALIFLAVTISQKILAGIDGKSEAKTTSNSTETLSAQSESPQLPAMHINVAVRHFAVPRYVATCILYQNGKEIKRQDVTVGMALFSNIGADPDDNFSAEMQYRDPDGTVTQITTSSARKTSDLAGTALDLEPEWEFDRVFPSWEKKR